MCISSMILLPPLVQAPEELDPTYYKFLLYHGGKSFKILNTCKSKIMTATTKETTLCPYIHPDEECIPHSIKFFFTSLPRSLRLYIPLYIILYILNPKRDVILSIKNMIRSTVFLSTYCTSAWLSSCIYDFINHSKLSTFKSYSHIWPVGLTSIIETPKRRTELATYCLTYALDRVYRYLEKRDYIEDSPVDNTLIISMTTGILIYYRKIPFSTYILM